MSWMGKIVGGAIGFALGGPLGAVAGATFGHAFDVSDDQYLSNENRTLSSDEKSQLAFFVAAFSMLAKLAKEREFQGMTADVLPSNMGMLKVFEKGKFPVKKKMEDGVYAISMDLVKPEV